MEEIETKSFTEQSSEEIQREKDEGTKIPFFITHKFFSASVHIFNWIVCIYTCVCSAEDMPTRALPAQRALQSMEKGKLLFLIKLLY